MAVSQQRFGYVHAYKPGRSCYKYFHSVPFNPLKSLKWPCGLVQIVEAVIFSR
jgi:hypothetical protein